MQSSQKRAAVGPVPIVPWNRFRALCLGFRTWVDIHVATSEDATQRGGFLEVASFCSMDCRFKEEKT